MEKSFPLTDLKIKKNVFSLFYLIQALTFFSVFVYTTNFKHHI